MIIVVGEVRFGKGELQRLRTSLEMLAAASRHEPGCLHFSLAYDALDPDLLIVSHRWSDEHSMGAHYRSGHVLQLNDLVDEDKIEAMSIKAYDGRLIRTLMSR
ncbi:MAG TPA: putative quinol monooxygenase [Allosphingosinicella sp.]